MKRNYLVGASLSALLVAAMAPWSAAHANGVSVRVSTPEFGIRIGAPHFPPQPVFVPVPVHHPRHFGHLPPPVVFVAPPRVIYGSPHHWRHSQWRHPQWRQPQWRHPHAQWRQDRRQHDDDDDGRRRHWR